MHHFPCVRVPIVSSPPGPHRRLSAPDSVTYLDNVEAFVSPAGGIGLRAARPISADSILMSVDNRWILDADAALADPVMGPTLADLEANGEACATDHYSMIIAPDHQRFERVRLSVWGPGPGSRQLARAQGPT